MLTSYSRSSELYAALHTNGCRGKRVKTNDEVFRERIIAQPFTRRDSANCVVTLEHNINILKAAKESFQENIKLALQTSDPLEENMEYVNTCKAEIEEWIARLVFPVNFNLWLWRWGIKSFTHAMHLFFI